MTRRRVSFSMNSRSSESFAISSSTTKSGSFRASTFTSGGMNIASGARPPAGAQIRESIPPPPLGPRALGVQGSKDELGALFDSFDTDRGGSISLDELYKQLRAGADVDLSQTVVKDKLGNVLKVGYGAGSVAVQMPSPRKKKGLDELDCRVPRRPSPPTI